LRKFDVVYFTASCDTEETNKKFAEKLNLDYPILSDPEGDVARAYGVIDGKRKAPSRWTYYIGGDGKILFIDKKVAAGSHGKDVSQKLKELGVKEK
jgi:peroxiredoxin Q/BCP